MCECVSVLCGFPLPTIPQTNLLLIVFVICLVSGFASGSMHGSFTGIRGPFTPAQWIELEHQALIYKYFTANVPVPATLLVPIRKALYPSGFSGFSTGSFPAHSCKLVSCFLPFALVRNFNAIGYEYGVAWAAEIPFAYWIKLLCKGSN